MNQSLLSTKPKPDFGRLACVLSRQGEPDRVPLFEAICDIEQTVMDRLGKTVSGEKGSRFSLHVQCQEALGYDYARVGPKGFSFPAQKRESTETKEGKRSYALGSSHTIANRDDFEAYAWPDMKSVDYSSFEEASTFLPKGMKAIGLVWGVFEPVIALLGYEGISYLLADDEELVKEMFDAVGSRVVESVERITSFDSVGAILMGEDMGFKTSTMLSPDTYRKYLFPWHKKINQTAHANGKPTIIHSCGNLESIMDDLIDCGWDAKHSFQDIIEPVWDAKARYGNRIALLGGFDMDKISRFSAEEVRAHTRTLFEKCASGGGWAIGAGNSIANYVPVENYLAMVDKAHEINGRG